MDVELIVTQSSEDAAEVAARVLAGAAKRGGAIALAGGSTPRRAYELVAEMVPDWRAVDVYFGDDRVVPSDDPRSNQRLVRESLLDGLSVQPRAVHGIRADLGPEGAAAAYDALLNDVRLDLVLLGLGSDGHTASLFPESPALEVRDRRAVAADAGLEPFVPRVTLTVSALAEASEIVFLAVGPDKAEPARRAFAEEPSRTTPASLVRSAAGRTTVILDAAAAALIVP